MSITLFKALIYLVQATILGFSILMIVYSFANTKFGDASVFCVLFTIQCLLAVKIVQIVRNTP